MNRRGFLKKLGLAAGATATALTVPEWLLDPPKGRSMISVPGPAFRKWVTALDPATRHLSDDAYGGFLIPENFSVALLRDAESNRILDMIRRDVAQSLAAKVEADFLTGYSKEAEGPSGLISRTRLTEEFTRRRFDELKEKMGKLSEEFNKAALATTDFRLALEPIPRDEVFLKAQSEIDVAIRHDEVFRFKVADDE